MWSESLLTLSPMRVTNIYQYHPWVTTRKKIPLYPEGSSDKYSIFTNQDSQMWDNTQQKHGPLSVDLESLSNNRKMGRLVICRRQVKLRVCTLLQKKIHRLFQYFKFHLKPFQSQDFKPNSPKGLNTLQA